MRYEGTIYRPPSEAYSYILQVTVGCAHNRCTFCSMYKDKKFRVRDVEEVFEDIRMARARFTRVGRVFLADGDALCLKTDKLIAILDYITETLPECERITSYGSAKDVLLKTPEELEILRDYGFKIIYRARIMAPTRQAAHALRREPPKNTVKEAPIKAPTRHCTGQE